MTRIIYYYQTFIGLRQLLEQKPICVTHIIISSIHFGYKDNKPYIHLNDNNPDDPIFDELWSDIKIADNLGIKIILMIGGAGLAYQKLFSNFNIFYNMLKNEILKRPYISGVDLDVEEITKIEYIQLLIDQIDKDFGKDFIITMAPIASSLQFDDPGLGGFSYKKLLKSNQGGRINWFNCQFYNCYNLNSYIEAILNGYSPDKVVFGMISSNFNKETFPQACSIIKSVKSKYSDFGGVFNWEYYNSPPDIKNPYIWSLKIKSSI